MNYNTSIKKEKWEESYCRSENHIFYPKEEVIKFINRFVRKRIGTNKFKDILDFSKTVRGLDYGCGIGRQTILMKEFGMDAYGLDISEAAISRAKDLASYFGFDDLGKNFRVIDGISIPFEKEFFDITICESVIDSMHFDLAKILIHEIGRVTKELIYISLISDLNGIRSDEEIVQIEHEKGTVQSYYNELKIEQLLNKTNFKIQWKSHIVETDLQTSSQYGRYYLVLKKN